jgi:3-hydroxyisobutyrate dehydrogenase-like beta-hydroxyacid dehydrogenase
LLWFGQAIATAEAMLLARRAELDLDVLRQALTSSAASSVFIRDPSGWKATPNMARDLRRRETPEVSITSAA